MSLPTSGCGIRNDIRNDGTMDMSVRLVIQMDEKLRQLTDMERVVRCNLPNQMMEINIGMTEDRRIYRYSAKFGQFSVCFFNFSQFL